MWITLYSYCWAAVGLLLGCCWAAVGLLSGLLFAAQPDSKPLLWQSRVLTVGTKPRDGKDLLRLSNFRDGLKLKNMPSNVFSAAIIGLDGQIIEIETEVSYGLRRFEIVGLADKAVEESTVVIKHLRYS